MQKYSPHFNTGFNGILLLLHDFATFYFPSHLPDTVYILIPSYPAVDLLRPCSLWRFSDGEYSAGNLRDEHTPDLQTAGVVSLLFASPSLARLSLCLSDKSTLGMRGATVSLIPPVHSSRLCTMTRIQAKGRLGVPTSWNVSYPWQGSEGFLRACLLWSVLKELQTIILLLVSRWEMGIILFLCSVLKEMAEGDLPV